MKQRNEVHQVKGYDPAFDQQHEQPLFGFAVLHLRKRLKKKYLSRPYNYSMQLNVERLTVRKLHILERLALEYIVTNDILKHFLKFENVNTLFYIFISK